MVKKAKINMKKMKRISILLIQFTDFIIGIITAKKKKELGRSF
jgi:hypothetical protein